MFLYEICPLSQGKSHCAFVYIREVNEYYTHEQSVIQFARITCYLEYIFNIHSVRLSYSCLELRLDRI
jgi:hypothetical protein